MDINNIIKQTIEELAKRQKRSTSSVAARYSAFEAQLRNVAIREMSKEDLAKEERVEPASNDVADAIRYAALQRAGASWDASKGGTAFHKAAEKAIRETKDDSGEISIPPKKQFKDCHSSTSYIMVPSSFASVSQREAYIEGLDKEIGNLESVNKELHVTIDRNHQSVSLLVGRKVMANHTPTEGRESGCNAWDAPKLR